MKRLLVFLMFPVFINGQSLQYTKWDVQTLQSNNLSVLFQNDTMRWEMAGIVGFVPVAIFQDSSNFISIVDLPHPAACLNTGLYNYQILNDTLTFNVIDDTCVSRLSFFTNSTWTSLNTGIKDGYQSFSLKTYPNPSNNLIQIDIENYNGSFVAELYDFKGKLLETTNKTSLSLANYPSGIYLLKVAYGDIVEQLKVIKE